MSKRMPSEDKVQEQESKAKTAYDLIRMRLERLQQNIDKPVSIPQRRDPRKPKPPPEFVRNVVGSSAAAGSAEFHIFRNNRKREMDRLDYMNQQARQQELDAAFELKKLMRVEQQEKKTAKKRAKRQKYKQRMREKAKAKKLKKEDEADSKSDEDSSSSDEDSGENQAIDAKDVPEEEDEKKEDECESNE